MLAKDIESVILKGRHIILSSLKSYNVYVVLLVQPNEKRTQGKKKRIIKAKGNKNNKDFEE